MAQIELYVNTFFSVRSFVRLSFGPFNDRLQTGWEVSWSVRTVICVPFCLCVFVSFSFSLVRSLHATISHFDWSGFYWTCSGQLASVWYIRNVCEEAIISAFIKFESIIYTFFQYKILMFGSLANNVGTSESPVWFAVFVVALLRNSFPFCCCFFFPVLCVCVFAVRSLFEYSFFFSNFFFFSVRFFGGVRIILFFLVRFISASRCSLCCCSWILLLCSFLVPFLSIGAGKSVAAYSLSFASVCTHFCFSFLCVRFRCVSAELFVICIPRAIELQHTFHCIC